MKRRSLLKAVAALPVLPRVHAANERVWLGPQFWANPLQDWRSAGDRIECHVSGGDRNVFWLTRELGEKAGDFAVRVRLGRIDLNGSTGPGWVGFRFGMRGHFGDYRDTAIKGIGIEAGVTTDGRLFVGRLEAAGPRIGTLDDLELRLEAAGTRVTLRAGSESVTAEIPPQWLAGGVALVCHAGAPPDALPVMREPAAANSGKPNQNRRDNVRFWFRDWTLTGAKAVERPERAWGPILFAQYTLSRRVMKMTVQLAPVEGDLPPVELRARGRAIAKAAVEPISSTATFRVADWDDHADTPYTIAFQGHTYTGTIRRDPRDKPRIVVGALTCQGEFGFPHAPIARNLKHLNPDLLLFTGDQLYEANGGYGIQRAPLETARLDYLRKWYMFGWAWGELTRDIPCVSLADDHDVYHGNIWGAGGRRAEYPSGAEANAQQLAQDSGGYTMPARWVNAVYRTQSSHLPDPPDAAAIEQEISVHYGHLVWGGVSFALLEDRKWKSAPRAVLPEAKILNGFPQNPAWDSPKQGDVAGAQLLGERQERFLREWARDWNGIEMKAAVSGTIFCTLATLPAEARGDGVTGQLPVQPLGGFAANERPTQDHDSNGWPQTPRNRALRILRSCRAVHIAGDQHLGSTVQYGIDAFNDGPFAICSPAISNIFPRRWYPPSEGLNRKAGSPRNTGEYFDGFGNRITVHAVANPHQYGVVPRALNDRAPGFGAVEFDKKAGRITLTNYPRWVDLAAGGKPFDGWPFAVDAAANGQNGAAYAVRLPRAVSGVVEVYADGEADPVLCCRLQAPEQTFRVWAPGKYRVVAAGRAFEAVAERA